MGRFIEVVRADIDFNQSPKDMLRNTIVSFLRYIDSNRASWIVMYTQATSSQAFSQTVREGREQIIELVAGLVRAGTRSPRAGLRIRDDGRGTGRRGRGDGQPGIHR